MGETPIRRPAPAIAVRRRAAAARNTPSQPRYCPGAIRAAWRGYVLPALPAAAGKAGPSIRLRLLFDEFGASHSNAKDIGCLRIADCASEMLCPRRAGIKIEKKSKKTVTF